MRTILRHNIVTEDGQTHFSGQVVDVDLNCGLVEGMMFVITMPMNWLSEKQVQNRLDQESFLSQPKSSLG